MGTKLVAPPAVAGSLCPVRAAPPTTAARALKKMSRRRLVLRTGRLQLPSAVSVRVGVDYTLLPEREQQKYSSRPRDGGNSH